MSTNPSKVSRFWQELKRRKVIHVITVYASAAFVLIELVNNLTEPLNLPAGLATIVVIVLAVGFPPAVILSWLYDLTGRGIEKTKPQQELKEGEKISVPNARMKATQSGRDFMFIMSKQDKDIVLLKVSKLTGKIEGKIDLGKDREPIYAVDDITGQVYYLTGENELTSYQVK